MTHMINLFGYMIELHELYNLVENGTVDEIDLPDSAREALDEYRIEIGRAEYARAYESYVRDF